VAEAPSFTEPLPLRLTVVVSRVSVTPVTAGVASCTSDSKPPPLAPVMLTETLPASVYTSSPGAATEMLALVLPALMTICCPFESCTVTGVCAAFVSVAV
jgi:hypothetical protein